jgi:DNA invertase Pin-like site-specific DNA recombinase
MTMKPVAYSYIRFSSEPQAWGDSRRRQTAAATRYARQNNLTLDDGLTFQDLGVSAFRGRNSRTGALGAFLAAIELGVTAPGSYLLVESFDRLSRDQIPSAQALFLQIIQAGINAVTLIDGRLYSAQSGINTNPYELPISLVSMMRRMKSQHTSPLASMPHGIESGLALWSSR